MCSSDLPKPLPPERSLSMNVLVATRKKANARPSLQMLYANRHSARTEIKRTPRDPFHIRQRREHAANNGHRIDVKHLARLEPAQNLAGRIRECHVQRCTKLRAGRTTLPAEMRSVIFQNAPPLAARSVLDNNKFQIGIILIDDRPQSSLEILIIAKSGSNYSYARQRSRARLWRHR